MNYFSFISYRGCDYKIAKKLETKFLNYKLPSNCLNPIDKDDRTMRRVFRDRNNLRGGKLLPQIKEAIDDSMFVVLVCTPNMTKTEDRENYVNDEIEYLIKTNRIDSCLIPLVYEGKIYSPDDYVKKERSIEEPFEEEAAPYALRKWMEQNNNHESTITVLYKNEQGEDNEEKMFLKCVATIINVPFETLWDKYQEEKKIEKRNKIKIALSLILSIILLITVIIHYMKPLDVKIRLNEVSIHNNNLPELKDAIVSIAIDDYYNIDTLIHIDDYAILNKVPRSYIGEDVRLLFKCKDWNSLDTIVRLTKDISINIARNPFTYGEIQFYLWNSDKEKIYPNESLSINGHKVTSDDKGRIIYYMPLEEQDTVYKIETHMQLYESYLYMPTTQSTTILVK